MLFGLSSICFTYCSHIFVELFNLPMSNDKNSAYIWSSFISSSFTSSKSGVASGMSSSLSKGSSKSSSDSSSILSMSEENSSLSASFVSSLSKYEYSSLLIPAFCSSYPHIPPQSSEGHAPLPSTHTGYAQLLRYIVFSTVISCIQSSPKSYTYTNFSSW